MGYGEKYPFMYLHLIKSSHKRSLVKSLPFFTDWRSQDLFCDGKKMFLQRQSSGMTGAIQLIKSSSSKLDIRSKILENKPNTTPKNQLESTGKAIPPGTPYTDTYSAAMNQQIDLIRNIIKEELASLFDSKLRDPPRRERTNHNQN